MNFLKNIFSSAKPDETKKEDGSLSHLSVDESDGTSTSTTSSSDTSTQERSASLWKIFSSKLGMDVVVGVTLPVWMNEPTTVLQRQAEMVHFHELLTEAAQKESSLERLAYVAVFATTAYNGTERYGKPFNPILGETFEFCEKESGIRFVAEQVSHHPPISAAYCEGRDFVFWQDSRPKSKFLGNSVDLEPSSKTHIFFPRTQDHFVYTPPTSRINNLIIGRIWIDHFGTLSITNLKNGEICTLTFEKCGWLGKGRHEINGVVRDTEGKDRFSISGKWSESMTVKGLDDKSEKLVWRRPANNSIGKHKMTEFALGLLEFDSDYERLLPPTDSRLRPDRIALERGDMSEAGIMKHKLEEKQRADKKSRLTKSEEWTPRWFKLVPEENGEGQIWTYSGGYWEQRQRKIELTEKLKSMPSVDPVVSASNEEVARRRDVELERDSLMARGIIGSACDFRSV